MHQFLKSLPIIVASIAYLFLSSPLFATSAEKDDIVHSFDFEQNDLKARSGFSYKRLSELFGDDAAELGVHVHDNGRKLIITDEEKFKKTFRDLHLGFLSFASTDKKILKFYKRGRSFDEDYYRILQNLCFGTAFIFNITSESAIRDSLGDEQLVKMINETLGAMQHYALSKINPKLTSAIRKLLADKQKDERDDEDAPPHENAGAGSHDDEHDEGAGDFDGGVGNMDGGYAHDLDDLPRNSDDELDDTLVTIREAKERLSQKKAGAKNLEAEGARLDDEVDDAPRSERFEENGSYEALQKKYEALKEEKEALEEEKLDLEERVETQGKFLQQQKQRIETGSEATRHNKELMALLLSHLNIDLKSFKNAMTNRDADSLKTLLSPALSGVDAFDETMGNIKTDWNPDDGDEEENSAAKGSGDEGSGDEEGGGDEGSDEV
ncbi:MAG: hypothetical protein ACTHJ4_08105 [Candidatus Nucleicultricaceae bacterium]